MSNTYCVSVNKVHERVLFVFLILAACLHVWIWDSSVSFSEASVYTRI